MQVITKEPLLYFRFWVFDSAFEVSPNAELSVSWKLYYSKTQYCVFIVIIDIDFFINMMQLGIAAGIVSWQLVEKYVH